MRKTILTLILCHTYALIVLGGNSVELTLPGNVSNKEKREKIKQLKVEADSLYDTNEYHKALDYYKAAETIIIDHSLEKDFPKIPYDIGYTYYMIDSMSLSVKYFMDYLESNPELTLKKKGKIYNKVAKAYNKLGDIEFAFDYQLKNRQIWEELKDTVQIGNSIYQLGSIQFSLGHYKDALNYYTEAYEINTVLNDSFTLFSCLAAIGGTYNRLGEIDKAAQYNNEALAITLAINYKIGTAYAYHNLAADYYDKKDFKQSLDYAKLSLDMMRQNNDSWGLSDCYRIIGLNYMMLNQLDDAKLYMEKASAQAEELDSKTQMVEALQASAELAEKTGDFKAKSIYLEKLLITKELIISESIQRKMESSKNNYEIYKRDKKINNLKKDREIQQLKSKTFGIILAFILPLFLVLIYLQHKLRKGNKLLASKNELIERQNEDLELSNTALEDSNKELEQFAYVASHDMMEPIRTIRSFNSLLKTRYADVLGERGNEFVYYVDDASKRLDIMLTDLLNYSRVNSKDKNKTIANLTETVKSAAMNLTHKFQDTAVTLNITPLPEVKVNPVQMERLFQNLIENGIKYNTQEQKVIDINYKKNGKAYIISVKDNGIGIESQYKEKVFEIFRRLHGTSEYAGSGIGLATCKKIVEKHNGKIWLDSKPNKGTTIFFTIPFHKKEEVA